MDKKKSLIERAESKAGLRVQLYRFVPKQVFRRTGYPISKVRTGSISLQVTRYLEDESLTLCIAMHTYIGLLLKISGPHFEWDEASQSAKVSALGARLLLCADLFDEYLGSLAPLDWNDGHIYLHSAYVNLFRATVIVAVDKVRLRQGLDYVDGRRLEKADVELLNRAAQAALRWISRPNSCQVNRRLYVEWKKTERSIHQYIDGLSSKTSQAVTVLVKLDTHQGYLYAPKEPLPELYQAVGPYVELFKIAASFIAQLKKVFPEALLGYLVKVTQSKEGKPQCVVLFSFAFASGPASWETLLQAFEVDFNNKRVRKLSPPIRLDVMDLTEILKKQPGPYVNHVRTLVNDFFVKELRYRRLNLPMKRRSWSRAA